MLYFVNGQSDIKVVLYMWLKCAFGLINGLAMLDIHHLCLIKTSRNILAKKETTQFSTCLGYINPPEKSKAMFTLYVFTHIPDFVIKSKKKRKRPTSQHGFYGSKSDDYSLQMLVFVSQFGNSCRVTADSLTCSVSGIMLVWVFASSGAHCWRLSGVFGIQDRFNVTWPFRPILLSKTSKMYQS